MEGRSSLAIAAEPAQKQLHIKGHDHIGNEPGQVFLRKYFFVFYWVKKHTEILLLKRTSLDMYC